MSTSLPVKCHLPLITTRIEFEFNVLPSPPQITPRRDLGAVIRRRARRNMPYIRPDREVTPIATNTKRFESPLTEIDSEADTSDVESTTSYKISKPKGEAGKTNSGGYNLQCAMGWENTEFSNFTVSRNLLCSKNASKLLSEQKYINEEAAKKLDVKICYSKQRREDLDNLIQSV